MLARLVLCVAVCMRADVDTSVYSIRWLPFHRFCRQCSTVLGHARFDELRKPERKPVIMIGGISSSHFQLVTRHDLLQELANGVQRSGLTMQVNNGGRITTNSLGCEYSKQSEASKPEGLEPLGSSQVLLSRVAAVVQHPYPRSASGSKPGSWLVGGANGLVTQSGG